jgi:hypothetical protein
MWFKRRSWIPIGWLLSLANLVAVWFAGAACASTPVPSAAAIRSDAPADARAFYERYAAALKAHRRETLASFYSPHGALIVINGARYRLTNRGIDSVYRGAGWQGPLFFAWDSLAFEVLSQRQVLVTGGFGWLRAGSADTSRYIYLSILDATPSGLKIRVEHETDRPRSQ